MGDSCADGCRSDHWSKARLQPSHVSRHFTSATDYNGGDFSGSFETSFLPVRYRVLSRDALVTVFEARLTVSSY